MRQIDHFISGGTGASASRFGDIMDQTMAAFRPALHWAMLLCWSARCRQHSRRNLLGRRLIHSAVRA